MRTYIIILFFIGIFYQKQGLLQTPASASGSLWQQHQGQLCPHRMPWPLKRSLPTCPAATSERLQNHCLFWRTGPPPQTVVKVSPTTDPANPGSSAGAVDLVSAVIYDEFGREQRKYLPLAPTMPAAILILMMDFQTQSLQQQADSFTIHR